MQTYMYLLQLPTSFFFQLRDATYILLIPNLIKVSVNCP